ncbi:MAG: 2-C-methyl-D-erythritol 2,4-cyclodiphosphate synthase [Candidatus Peregrinibacteria bacterium]
MNHAIILAAGQGKRMKSREDKMLLPAGGHPLIYYSLMAFNDNPEIDSVVVVANKSNKKQIENAVRTYLFPKVKKVITGGTARQDSVEKGLEQLEKFAKPADIILVHNGANPLVTPSEISECIAKTTETGACITGHYVTSTIKEVDGSHIIKTHDRKRLFAAETPQAASFRIMKKAIKEVKKLSLSVTDEAMMFEAIDQKTAYISSGENNFKITAPADYERLRMILGDLPEDFRVGIGQDSHMFEEKKKGLVLGGVKISDELKLKANSDGDVILHAVFNAISQAVGEYSLGFYADPLCEKGVKDSKKYLSIAIKNARKKGFQVHSLGVMIEAARPKIDPLIAPLKKSLSNLLTLSPSRIGITASTGNGTSVFGEGLGIQCLAIVSLKNTSPRVKKFPKNRKS